MNVEQQIALSKAAKETWIQIDERGDIPPVVLLEKNGQELCRAFAPQVDKHMGLTAARLLKAGFEPDSMTLLFDAHFTSLDASSGMTEEEIAKKFPPGSMQKMCDEQGACDAGLITDCIISVSISRDASIRHVTIPYSYHGKGTAFRWHEEKILVDDEGKPDSKVKLTGMIASTLREIMKSPPAMQTPAFKKMVSYFGFSPDSPEAQIRMGRSILAVLVKEGFMVVVSEEIAKYGPIPGVDLEKL